MDSVSAQNLYASHSQSWLLHVSQISSYILYNLLRYGSQTALHYHPPTPYQRRHSQPPIFHLHPSAFSYDISIIALIKRRLSTQTHKILTVYHGTSLFTKTF